MATISLRIPTTAFNSGQPLYGVDPASALICVPLQEGALEYIGTSAKEYEDWQFHPTYAGAYNDILRFVQHGTLEVALSGTPQTPAQLITLYKSFYQEL